MAVSECPVVFVLLSFLWTFNRGDAVFCVLTKSCILPCTFKPGNEVVLHWILGAGNNVHSYYHNKDQLAYQNERFKDRTLLFKDQIFGGNASLQLTKVEFLDQGSYKCYTSTIMGNQESFIDVNVEALIQKINIQLVGNRIVCSSEGLYPKPELSWSTSLNLENTTTVQETEQKLYNISSFLTVSDSVTDLVYKCIIRSGRNSRTATLFKPRPTSINASATETTIPCTSSNTPLTDLIWRFNHSQIILRQTRTDSSYTVSEEWRQQVKGVSESGSLTLRDLSSNQEGTYTCELSNEEETHITNTVLQIKEDSSTGSNSGVIIGGVIGAILVIFIGLTVYIYSVCRKKKDTQKQTATTGSQSSEPPETAELIPVPENGGGQV